MAKPVVRIQAIQFAYAVAFAILLGRAAFVQLFEGKQYRARARTQRTEHVTLTARRGAINDRAGSPLAVTQHVYRVGVAPNELAHPDDDALVIARHTGLPDKSARRWLQRRWVWVPGRFNSAQVQPIRHIRGVHLDSSLGRFHPNAELADTLLGNPARPGRTASGVERYFDSLLTGEDGSAVVLRDHIGRVYQSPARLDSFPVPGHDVFLTIDAQLQDLVEQALADAIDQFDADGGDVVMMEASTGELLAVVSRQADGKATANSFASAFEPGSTAKLFAAATLLSHNLVGSKEIVWGEGGEYRIGGRDIHDSEPEGWMTLRDVIKRSSNIGIAKFAERMSPEQQFTTLRDFGFGMPTGVESPAESYGILRRPDRWSGTSAVSHAIGYEFAVTMMQLVQAYGAIANDGVMLRPTIVREIRAPDGAVVYEHTPEAVRRVVSADVARRLRGMLEDVVGVDGTGTPAALANYKVAGKTGTARRAGPTGYIAGSYTATFASLFPADKPQLVMIVKLDNPEGGYARLSAAPLTRSMLMQVLAAETAALDFAEIGERPAAPQPPPVVADGAVPYVVTWPRDSHAAPRTVRPVPDVRGLSVREAARRLHDRGFRVRLEGWGTVRDMEPDAGSDEAPGTMITLRSGRVEATP
jgi:cell division protein FtsI (penicillin-binding protein 3)